MQRFTFLVKKPTRNAKDCVEGQFSRQALMYKVILWNHRTTHYLVFNSPHEAEQYIVSKPLSERTYSEVILGWRPQKLRFDIDDATVENCRSIIAAIRKVWATTSLIASTGSGGVHKTKLLLFQSDSPDKNGRAGYHILINYYVKDATIAREFSKEVITLLAQTDKVAANCIDNAYAANQNMRVVGCLKYDTKSKKLGSFVKQPITRGVTFADSLASLVLKR